MEPARPGVTVPQIQDALETYAKLAGLHGHHELAHQYRQAGRVLHGLPQLPYQDPNAAFYRVKP